MRQTGAEENEDLAGDEDRVEWFSTLHLAVRLVASKTSMGTDCAAGKLSFLSSTFQSNVYNEADSRNALIKTSEFDMQSMV